MTKFRRFHSYYNITLERSNENYNEINLTHYIHKYNKNKNIKPSSAREEAIIQNLKDMMTDLQMSRLEVKLKE